MFAQADEINLWQLLFCLFSTRGSNRARLKNPKAHVGQYFGWKNRETGNLGWMAIVEPWRRAACPPLLRPTGTGADHKKLWIFGIRAAHPRGRTGGILVTHLEIFITLDMQQALLKWCPAHQSQYKFPVSLCPRNFRKGGGRVVFRDDLVTLFQQP